MLKRVLPSPVRGSVRAPPSKSLTQRALFAGLLARGETLVANPSPCEDARAAVIAVQALGARVEPRGANLVVRGGGEPVSRLIDCGESGLCLRTCAPVAALFDGEFTLRAAGSLLRRPMEMLCAPLASLGAECRTEGGFAPVTVRGPLRGGSAEVDASLSSQPLTGLLMALPVTEHGGRLAVTGLESKPYVEMTVELLRHFGVAVSHDAAWRQIVVPGRQRYAASRYEVEGDWSAAAFLLVAGAIAGAVTVEGLRSDSKQADRAVLEALRLAGATLRLAADSVTAEQAQLRAVEIDLSDAPDLLPPLAALATCAAGASRFSGVGRTRIKESDRVHALAEELGRLGASVREERDALVVEGGRLRGGRVRSHGDHRIAMACAVAALCAEGEVEIEGAECVSKSYPAFFEALQSLAAR